jgi:hypothetical protein
VPQLSPGDSIPTSQYIGASIRFASVTQSDGTRTMSEAPAFLSADQIHVEFVPGRSISSFGLENANDKAGPTTSSLRYEAV